MSTPERVERRSHGAPGALHATKRAHGGPKIGGLAIPFGQWSEDLGGFKEQILAGAFSASIETDDQRSLFNHDSNFVLGRKSAGTLRLTEDERGVSYEVDAPDTQWARDLAESIRRGDIRENSFAMFVTDDIWEERDGMMWRTVRIGNLREVGPQPFPAYPQSSVDVRSIEATLAHGRQCVGSECRRGGQDPDVLLRELELDRGGLTRTGASYSDVLELQRELDSRSPLPAAPTKTRVYPRPSEFHVQLGNGYTGPKIRATSFHEAGHAVHALLDGCHITRVSLLWRRDRTCGSWEFRGGECVTRGGTDTAAMHLAGRVAAKLAGLGSANPESWSDVDTERARKCTKHGLAADRHTAESRLRHHWPAVNALARRLMVDGTVSGVEAEEIITENFDLATRSRFRRAA